MKTRYCLIWALLLVSLALSCHKPGGEETSTEVEKVEMNNSEMMIVNLSENDKARFEAIRKSFSQRNSGYDMSYNHESMAIEPKNENRTVFIQTGGGTATISAEKSSKFSIGDIILLKKGEGLTTDSLFSSLIFSTPKEAPNHIPPFIRPDWDPNITDVPGGCATETNAYRRILLTWADKVGEYLFDNINAHRVRIMDSFSHYHPIEGGFDEFYLVQIVLPDAKIITSNQIDLIENPLSVTEKQAENLLQSHKLKVGDLVYLPRGVMHRGVGGVLAQVITVPGFIPNSEIGVDHHLLKINKNLGLTGENQIPYNEKASVKEVIK